MRSSILSLFVASMPGMVAAQDRPAASPSDSRLREVRVVCSDVFAADKADASVLAGLVNTLHVTTRQEVILREIWFERGQTIDAEQAAELERNLRALGLFAEVTVRLVPTGNPGEVDVEIATRDHLTLSFGGGGSYVGGVTGLRAAIGESNLLGQGNRLAAAFATNSEDEYRGSLAYTDLHVLDSWHTGSVRLSRTDDGDSVGLELRRPFKHLADPRSYSFAGSHDESEVDYYRDGDSLAQVRDIRSTFRSNVTWADGPRNRRRLTGLEFGIDKHDYSPATGLLASTIRVAGDTYSVFLGPTARWEWTSGYREVEGVDTLDYVQDLTLGTTFGVTLGARWRDEQGREGALQPELAAAAGWAAEPLTDLYTNVTARGGLRWDGGSAAGWYASGAARAFALVSEADTLAASVAFDAVEEDQDLPVELTLGEDNGLRGYPARGLAGTRRLRANFENRFDTGIEVATLRLGIIAFYDTGWVGRGGDLGPARASAGIGLRIGSKELLGAGILRIDLARPFDAVHSEDDGWQLSISVGQVFAFDGYANTLSVR